MNEIKDAIRRYILSTHLAGESPDNLRDTTPLVTSGILDSLAALGLISFVEEHFQVELDMDDTSIEHFDQIEAIASTVSRKRAAVAGGRS